MVDLLLLERILSDINANIGELRLADDNTWDVYQNDVRSRRFVEQTLHIIIEAMIDALPSILFPMKVGGNLSAIVTLLQFCLRKESSTMKTCPVMKKLLLFGI